MTNDKQPRPGLGLQVCGRAAAAGTPDVVRIRVGVSALRPTVAEALAVADAAARQVRAALAARGVAGKDAATASLTVGAEQVWDPNGVPRPTGYRADQELAVTTRDVAGLGTLLGEVLAAAGDEVRLNGLQFEVEDDTTLRVLARQGAWADALARATQLAGLAGRSLGPVLDLVEEAGYGGGPGPVLRAAAAKEADLSVDPGSVAVEVSLTVRWALD